MDFTSRVCARRLNLQTIIRATRVIARHRFIDHLFYNLCGPDPSAGVPALGENILV